jgi:hypothetical protein
MSNRKIRKEPKDDSPVGDVRRVRMQLSERFGNDVRRLGEHARRVAEETRQKLGCNIVRKADRPSPSTTQ